MPIPNIQNILSDMGYSTVLYKIYDEPGMPNAVKGHFEYHIVTESGAIRPITGNVQSLIDAGIPVVDKVGNAGISKSGGEISANTVLNNINSRVSQQPKQTVEDKTPIKTPVQVTPSAGIDNGQPTKDFSSPVTGKFKDSAAYKALSAEERELVDLAFNVNFQGDEAEYEAYASALSNAMQLADPYAKSQLAMAKAEVGLALAKTTDDFKRSRDILERTRIELASDIKMYKDELSLEQQSDMATVLRGYDEDMLTIADQAAEKGLTFATGARSRELAESRRGEQYQDVVQSSRRQFNLKNKELELKAARGDQEAVDKLAELDANKGFQLTEIGQKAEQLLGSVEASKAVGGFAPAGGALGSIEQERRKSILDIAQQGVKV